MKKKRNKKNNRANEVHGTHGTAEEKTDKQPMSVNPAADLEQSLKSRMDVMKYRGQIRDIRVSESKSGRSLIVTILPEGEIVSFGTITVDLSGIDSAAKWKRKKKTVYGNVNGLTPRVNPAFYQKLREEVNAALQRWRQAHPFSDEMRDALHSGAAREFFGSRRMETLRFLAGKGMPGSGNMRTTFTANALEAEWKSHPYKAVCDFRTGKITFSLSRADSLYERFSRSMKEIRTLGEINAYLKEKEIPAKISYAGKPGSFQLTFPFALSTETETVAVEKSYKRIVLAGFLVFAASLAFARERYTGEYKSLSSALRTKEKTVYLSTRIFAQTAPLAGILTITLFTVLAAAGELTGPLMALRVIMLMIFGWIVSALWSAAFSALFKKEIPYLLAMVSVLVVGYLLTASAVRDTVPVLGMVGHLFPMGWM